MSCVVRTLVALLWIALGVSTARAHVEGAELAADVVWDTNSVRFDLRIAVRELILSEQPIESVILPDYNQDPKLVMDRHAEYVVSAFEIKYDGKPLTGRLIESSVQDLVIGVNEEDIVPRKCAVYSIEFTRPGSEPGPSRIDLIMSMFKLPLEAGFQPTVLCMASHRLASSETTRMTVIGLEDVLTIRPEWSAVKAAAPGAVIAATPDPTHLAQSARRRGPMIMVGIAAGIGLLLVIVLARRGTA